MKNKKVSAIAWAAQIAGESYGKYAAALSEEQKEAIYAKFDELLEEQKLAERVRLAGSARSVASL